MVHGPVPAVRATAVGGRRGRVPILVLDALGALVALAVVALAFGDAALLGVAPLFGLVLCGPLLAHALADADCHRHALGSGLVNLARLLTAAAAATWLGEVFGQAIGAEHDAGRLIPAWLLAGALWMGFRLLRARSSARRPDRAVIVGSGPQAVRLATLMARHPEHGVVPVGFIDEDPMPLPDDAPPLLGGVTALESAIRSGECDRVIIAFSEAIPDREIVNIMRATSLGDVRVEIVPRMFDLLGQDLRVNSLGAAALIEVGPARRDLVRRGVKRGIDIAGATLGLVLLSPFMALVAIAIRLEGPGPILFRQERVGARGRRFNLVKFRSMTVDAGVDEADADLARVRAEGIVDPELDLSLFVEELKRSGELRTTRVGRIIRRTSLDELPQLWNVLKGDMSLVGPRPLRPFEVAGLRDWQRLRQEVRPGLTGLWQVMGRSDVGWDERIQMDYTYARHWSLRQDLRVLARTIRVVVRQEGSK